MENSQLSPAINLMETQQPIPDDIVRNDEEDLQLLVRARAVGVQYEFAQHGAPETEEDRRRRRLRNQRRVSHWEGRLREVVGDLPPPPLAGSSQVEDNAYSRFDLRSLEGTTSGMRGHKKRVLGTNEIRKYQGFGQKRTTWTQRLSRRFCLERQMVSRC